VHLLTFVPYLCPLNAFLQCSSVCYEMLFCISYLDLLSAGVPMTFNILKGKLLILTKLFNMQFYVIHFPGTNIGFVTKYFRINDKTCFE
jgi:hypothetical protein